MLTASKKRTMAGICRLVALPAAVLRSIGSFLTTYECFVAVRTCKNNEGLKPLLTSIEKIKFKRANVLPDFVSVIEPSLISSIGCSVKILAIYLCQENVGALVQLLPRLGSLQHLQISFGPLVMRLMGQVFASIPQRVRCLTLGWVDGEALRYLGEAATAGCLPVLEELAFPFLEVRKVEDMTGFQTALMAPSLGKNLKVLMLDFQRIQFRQHIDFLDTKAFSWRLLEPLLRVEDQTNGILSRLETLVLRSFTGWEMLAEYLSAGERLPALKEVYSREQTWGKYGKQILYNMGLSRSWYEVDPVTCRSWFELLRRRPLQTFNRIVHFSYNWETDNILELFRCLSDRALEPKCISAIKVVTLTSRHELVCRDTLEALAGAMRSGNLRSVKCLALVANTRCTSESLASLGTALDRAFLPCLSSFSFGMEDPQDDNMGDLELEDPSLLLKSFFGSIPTGGLDNLRKFELERLYSSGAGILVNALAKFRPSCFRHLPEVWISDLSREDMEKTASIFEAGVFPCVECVKIVGKSTSNIAGWHQEEEEEEDFGEGMLRFLRALNDHTKIKELHVFEQHDGLKPTSQFARPLLESMLCSFSESTSPAFFPSLKILKIVRMSRFYQSGSGDMDPLLSRIKAVRPPNLQTITSEHRSL